MSTNIVFDNHCNVTISSSGGWMDFANWVSGLPIKEFPRLCHLVQNGWSKGLSQLVQEIDRALRNYSPRRVGVRSTSQGIRDQIRSQEHSAHIVMIGGGIVPPG